MSVLFVVFKWALFSWLVYFVMDFIVESIIQCIIHWFTLASYSSINNSPFIIVRISSSTSGHMLHGIILIVLKWGDKLLRCRWKCIRSLYGGWPEWYYVSESWLGILSEYSHAGRLAGSFTASFEYYLSCKCVSFISIIYVCMYYVNWMYNWRIIFFLKLLYKF